MGNRYSVLTIRRKNVVVVTDAIARTDLSCLLTDGWHPKSELTLTLQSFGFAIKSAHARHIAVELQKIGFG